MARISGSELVQFEGFDELIGTFDRMAADSGTKRRAIAKALRAGGKLIQNEAQRRAPYHRDLARGRSKASLLYGPLVKNIKVAVVDQSSEGAEADIGITSDGFYGKFHEKGTRHQRKRAWLEPSYDAKVDQAVEMVADEMSKFISEQFNGQP